MKIIEINKRGELRERNVLRKTLAAELNIHLRDFRPVFVNKQVATITPRGGVIILNFGEIKMVVTSELVLLSNLEEHGVKDNFIPELYQFIKTNTADSFEFLVLEFALNYKVEKSQKKFTNVERQVQGLLRKIQTKFTEKNLASLLQWKKKISRFKINIEENEAAALEVMEDEEELTALYLSLGRSSSQDTEEAESILESFLEQVEDINHKLTRLEEDIDDTQEIITLTLSNRRNTIIQFDLVATIITGILALLTLGTGIFGMNIRNNMENSHDAFMVVVWIMLGLFVVLGAGAWIFFKRRKLI